MSKLIRRDLLLHVSIRTAAVDVCLLLPFPGLCYQVQSLITSQIGSPRMVNVTVVSVSPAVAADGATESAAFTIFLSLAPQ